MWDIDVTLDVRHIAVSPVANRTSQQFGYALEVRKAFERQDLLRARGREPFQDISPEGVYEPEPEQGLRDWKPRESSSAGARSTTGKVPGGYFRLPLSRSW
jgi:hypothetical protein